MWPLLLVCVCGLLLPADAQDRASLWRGNDRGGRCQYTFTVPSPVESSCPQTAGPEVEGLKARLGLLEALVSRLTAGDTGGPRTAGAESGLQEALNRVVGERNLLQGEKERLERELGGLQRRMEEMRRETEKLRNRPCPPHTSMVPPSPSLQDRGLMRPAGGSSQMSHLMTRPNRQGDSSSLRDPGWEYRAPGFQELKAEVTEVPAPDVSEDNTGCGELLSVAEPVTHRKADNIAGKYGVWMQDPEAVSPYGPDMVWRIDTIGTEVRQMFGYEDMEQLSKGFPSKVLLLPELMESTGATLYRGCLYYQRRRSRTIIRYDLASESIAARRELPHAGFHGQYPYSWGGYTDIDLSVDEQGLWAVYSTSKAKGAIVISKLDPNTLEVKRSWETNIRKNSVANSFMICGRLYTVSSYAAPNTFINHMYDTASSQGKAVAIPFKNKYRYNCMIDYSLAQRKLFAWDNFHIVSYDLRLGRQRAD
ncbi:myocilin [Seriola lalandi dorsalis]|uniref:myocilin n=1 Tax=Seriola lalandi dorsalis TaxID=1841481 RepID=UPI000C6F89CB|nr:myocilin [Seriola lalandi dorsalis]XP_056233572.1 myocilin [Seriola aureovittata]